MKIDLSCKITSRRETMLVCVSSRLIYRGDEALLVSTRSNFQHAKRRKKERTAISLMAL